MRTDRLDIVFLMAVRACPPDFAFPTITFSTLGIYYMLGVGTRLFPTPILIDFIKNSIRICSFADFVPVIQAVIIEAIGHNSFCRSLVIPAEQRIDIVFYQRVTVV